MVHEFDRDLEIKRTQTDQIYTKWLGRLVGALLNEAKPQPELTRVGPRGFNQVPMGSQYVLPYT